MICVCVCVLMQNGGDGALAAAEPGSGGCGHHKGVQGETAALVVWVLTTAPLTH